MNDDTIARGNDGDAANEFRIPAFIAWGDRTGVLVASVSTLWTFIVAVFLWWFAAPSLLFVVELIYDAVRRAKPV